MTPELRLGVLAACLAFIWAAMISTPNLRGTNGLLEMPENLLFDWRVLTFGERDPPADIVIVALDDATLARSTVGEERQQLTAIVDAIAASGARVLALDILLTDTGTAGPDARLSDALRGLPTIIAGAAGGLATGAGGGVPQATRELWPQPHFLAAARVGLVNIITDASGMPRQVPTILVSSRGLVLSFALLAAAEFGGADPELGVGAIRLGARSLRLDQGHLLPLRPYGPAGSFPTVSALDLLDATAPSLEGKLVVLGSTATGLGDRFPSPFGGSLTGVEVMATAIGHHLEPVQVLTRTAATRRVDAGLAVTLAVFSTLAVLAMPLAQGLLVAGLLVLATLAGVWIAFYNGIWLAAALPLAAAGGPMALATMWRYSRERSQAIATGRAMTELRKFQSPQLAKMMEADPDFLSSPRTSEATILFVDLAGFTAMSQSLGPEDTEHLLKRFHRQVTRLVHEHGGLVFNYMGDGALAGFGLLDGDGQADPGAIAAAFELVEGMRLLEGELGLRGRLACRVGLHFGTVILSRLGDDMQQQFSVSGDSVNLTSRLLEAAKAERAAIAATVTAVPAHMPDLRPPDARKLTTLRGRRGEVEILFWLA